MEHNLGNKTYILVEDNNLTLWFELGFYKVELIQVK
jgi:hypothetical protein